ncbi:HD domain-containing phosphohydrolase [Halomonas llamarensis]|uniref:PilZ domain-containing protein n=1 Tax=Halomonas llamarensis TaxID=2945104 RepID=A0ABT0SNB4_9GAMM|nr:HD domain-containing phosphohydrolase [Halomonas llamarensis]MCL7929277.1 PilZ domain-containing protein [Halomonas llamarensis]
MSAQEGEYERVAGPVAIESLLDGLIESGGVSLCLNEAGTRPEPIVLMEQHAAETLVMDLSSVDHLLTRLQKGASFFLRGQAQGKVVRTPSLELTEVRHAGGRYLCCSDYPAYLDVLQRRESFRAELRMGMEVPVTLFGHDDLVAEGELRDLSQDGCQVELPMTASGILSQADALPLKMGLKFPDGTYFEVQGEVRHRKTDPDHQLLRIGLRFANCSSEQERQIWYFVCEIEREASRYEKDSNKAGRQPSPLFEASKKRSGDNIGQRELKHYATPMARRLAKVAAYLDSQMLLLQNGSDVNSRQLSRYADRLLALHEEDREALLFATRCMTREPLLVRHSLSVAVHLLDLVGPHIAQDLRKAIAASAMVHDLGKALVPQVLFQAPKFEGVHRSAMSEHVELILSRLHNCHWLSTRIAQAVIGGINERMDGSGYPKGLSGRQLHDLAKASAIVDVVEAMRRDRADRPARTAQQIYRHLLRHPHQFDPSWMKRYIEHFKALPIGSLVRFSGEQLAWVLRLDAKGNAVEVRLAKQSEPPSNENLGAVIRGDVGERLGRPVGEVAVST